MGGPNARGLRSAKASATELQLVLDATLEAVEAGRLKLAEYVEAAGLDARSIHRLEVIFEEVVANTVRHGFRQGSDQSIHVRAHAEPDRVQLVFEDDGIPFDPLQLAEPARYSDLATAKVGGRGVQLVRRLATALRYERPADGEGLAAGFQPRNRLYVTVASV